MKIELRQLLTFAIDAMKTLLQILLLLVLLGGILRVVTGLPLVSFPRLGITEMAYVAGVYWAVTR